MSTIVVDYGACNLDSVKRAVEECGASCVLSEDPASLQAAERIILPGVGSFQDAMQRIKAAGWDAALKKRVLESGIPLLGICLGMQLLGSRGEEGGGTDGLGLIPGDILKLRPTDKNMRVPHTGWNEVIVSREESKLFAGIPRQKDFYFVHSYHFVPRDPAVVTARTPYCGEFVSAVEKGHIFGVQFHPEKSQKAGFQVLRNFLELQPC